MKINNPPLAYSGISSKSANLLASRLFGYVYRNASPKPMFVTACIGLPTGAEAAIWTDQYPTPISKVIDIYNINVSALSSDVAFWVLPGQYYRLETISGSPLVEVWIEYL